jgi:hypothetical protein
LLALPGNFGDADGLEAGSVRDYVIVLAIAGVAALVVFGVVVRRGLTRDEAGASSLVLSVLGLVAVAVFWSGLSPVLAAGGILLGLAGWEAGQRRAMCRIAVVVGVLALVADVVVVLSDWRAIS